MKKLLFSLVALVLLVGCSPSPQAIERAIAKTQTAMPTATITPSQTPTLTPTFTPSPTLTQTPTVTSTKVSLSANMLIQDGDLPDTYSSRDPLYDGDNHYSQILVRDRGEVGHVWLYLYKDNTQAWSHYYNRTKDFGNATVNQWQVIQVKKLAEIGEESKYWHEQFNFGKYIVWLPPNFREWTQFSIISFVRCGAYVEILDKSSFFLNQHLIDYAKTLDERLIPYVCKEND